MKSGYTFRSSDRILIYDTEIINAVLPKGHEPDPDVKYCGGWDDYQGMEISVIVAYMIPENRYRVFFQDNWDKLNDILMHENRFVLGFNNKTFDDNLLRHWGLQINEEFSFDILRSIWNAAGLPFDRYDAKLHSGFNLDQLSKTNFALRKTGSGYDAPKDWQNGRYGSVVDYCINDVFLTVKLFEKIQSQGWIIDPRTGVDGIITICEFV